MMHLRILTTVPCIFFFLLIYWLPKSTKYYYTYIFKIHHTDCTITNYKQNTNTEPAFKILKQKQYKHQMNTSTLPETPYLIS